MTNQRSIELQLQKLLPINGCLVLREGSGSGSSCLGALGSLSLSSDVAAPESELLDGEGEGEDLPLGVTRYCSSVSFYVLRLTFIYHIDIRALNEMYLNVVKLTDLNYMTVRY